MQKGDSFERAQAVSFFFKSVNLQYITLSCLDAGTNKSSTKSLMFQVFVTLMILLEGFLVIPIIILTKIPSRRIINVTNLTKRTGLQGTQISLFLFLYFYKKKQENKLKGFFLRILQEGMKKMILGTSDPWSMIRLSHCPSDPAYYIVN